MLHRLRQMALSGLNVMLPPLCISCEEMVSESHGFCGTCWRGLTFIAAPHCACCGLPFEYEGQSVNEEALCGGCLQDSPEFKEARSTLTYNDASKAVLLPFKHADRTDFAPALAKLMVQAGQNIIEQSDMLIPVPLHFFRLFTRRYNQSALLAQYIGKTMGKPALLNGLIRIRATPSQGHLSREQRLQNVKNAFRVKPSALAQIKEKNILIIDDVQTTGATVNACAKALLKAGASQVRVLTLARVVKVDG